MKVVVGLGNPGRDYVATRHNVGFELIDLLAARFGLAVGAGEFDRVGRKKFDGLTLDGSVTLPSGQIEKILLLKPMTYMNLSGRSVQQVLAFYQVTPVDMLVALDDVALPVGKIRLRPNGSSGGHNGLKDIERALGTNEYPRLRMGVDAPPPRVPQKDYVLGRMTLDQRIGFDLALKRAADAVVMWMDKGMTAAMNVFNAADV